MRAGNLSLMFALIMAIAMGARIETSAQTDLHANIRDSESAAATWEMFASAFPEVGASSSCPYGDEDVAKSGGVTSFDCHWKSEGMGSSCPDLQATRLKTVRTFQAKNYGSFLDGVSGYPLSPLFDKSAYVQGDETYEQMDKLQIQGLCYPFPEPSGTCLASPGAAYRCASCLSGKMCYADRGCNTVIKLEEKVDEWKRTYYDPLLEKIAEAAQHVQAANNAADQAANAASWLAKCQGGSFNMCSEVKALADKLSNAIGSTFTEKHCPIPTPNIPFPNINPIKTLLEWLGKIAGVFDLIKLELAKVHCIDVPQSESWWERECTRICTSCCSYHWPFGIKCSNCCHNVCVDVLKTRYYMKKWCFSAMNILEGLGDFFQSLLGPILEVIEKAINALLSPITWMFDQILQLAGLNLDFTFPDIPTFEFNLPSLPAVDCNTLKNFVG